MKECRRRCSGRSGTARSRRAGRIDYDFAASFGKLTRFHAIRARYSDDLVRDFIVKHGNRACVVALGEGLETQFWRLGEPDMPWLSVDLPESIAARERLLPRNNTITHKPGSALDLSWIDMVPTGHVPFVSASGLLVYFEEAEVTGSCRSCTAQHQSIWARCCHSNVREHVSGIVTPGYAIRSLARSRNATTRPSVSIL